LWIDPANPLRMVQSNDGGANVSMNGGESWTRQEFATAQLYQRGDDARHSVSRVRARSR